MKHFIFLCLCVLFTAHAKAEDFQFGDFIPEKLIVDYDHVYVISSFDQIQYLTVYNFFGEFIWEVTFNSKIISVEVENEILFTLSKGRNGQAYYLSCFNIKNGRLIWEKPIWAPTVAGRS
jgi:outer membrane protein assembly factor BamB